MISETNRYKLSKHLTGKALANNKPIIAQTPEGKFYIWLSARKAGEDLGIPYNTIAHWASGRRAQPTNNPKVNGWIFHYLLPSTVLAFQRIPTDPVNTWIVLG